MGIVNSVGHTAPQSEADARARPAGERSDALEERLEVLLVSAALREDDPHALSAVMAELARGSALLCSGQVAAARALGSSDPGLWRAGLSVLDARHDLAHPLIDAWLLDRWSCVALRDDQVFVALHAAVLDRPTALAALEYDGVLRSCSPSERAAQLASLVETSSLRGWATFAQALVVDPSRLVQARCIDLLSQMVRQGQQDAIEFALVLCGLRLDQHEAGKAREELLRSFHAYILGSRPGEGRELNELRLVAAEIACAHARRSVTITDTLYAAHLALQLHPIQEDEALHMLIDGVQNADCLVRRLGVRFLVENLALVSERGEEIILKQLSPLIAGSDGLIALQSFELLLTRRRALAQIVHLSTFVTRPDVSVESRARVFEAVLKAKRALSRDEAERALSLALFCMRTPAPKLSHAAYRAALALTEYIDDQLGLVLGMIEREGPRLQWRALGIVRHWLESNERRKHSHLSRVRAILDAAHCQVNRSFRHRQLLRHLLHLTEARLAVCKPPYENP